MDEQMRNLNNDSTMPPDFLPRNKIYAVILIPLALILILFSGANILGILFAPRQLIADEIGPGLRIFQQLLFFAAAIAGAFSSVTAFMSSMNVSKFFPAGNRASAVAASEKADKNGKFLPFFIIIFGIVDVIFIVRLFLK